MSVEKGYIKYPVYRGNDEPYVLIMKDGDNNDAPLDVLAEYDEIKLQGRTENNDSSRLAFNLSLSAGTITVTNTNEVNFNLQTQNKAGVYFFDIAFRVIGTDNWKTLIKGQIVVEANNTRTS